MRVEPEQLKLFLTDIGVVTEKKFDEIQKKAIHDNKKIEDVLIGEGLISKEELTKLKAYILGIPFVNIENEKIPTEVLKIIPEPIARSNNIVAFKKAGNNLEVAMLDPEDIRTIEFIRKKSNLKILPRLTTEQSMKSILSQYQKTLEAEFGEIIQKESGEIIALKEEQQIGEDGKDLEKIAEELPIIKIVDTLIRHAVLQRASDIHVEPTEKEVIVRYRIDGVLRDAMVLPKTVSQGIVARIKVLSNLKLDEHRLPQDGRFKIETNEYKYSMRVSILPISEGEKIVMRLLAESTKTLSLEEIGFRGEALEFVQIALKKPIGMILITGPTGSGKTTTLYTLMEILNSPTVNISTVEDPIEYRMPRINQTQVNPKIGLTFASGLRALVRQDPDIIMVGEIRDNETASLAVNAALTGHMVLATLHTVDAAGAIPRLIDMKVEPFLIASTINIIIAQRLVRKLTASKEKYKLNKEEIDNIKQYCDIDGVVRALIDEKIIKQGSSFEDIVFFKPRPDKENLDGYSGRVGIFEVLHVTETIKDLIIARASSDKIQDQAQKEGMKTIIEDGFIKAAQGITSIEEVLRVIAE